MEVVESFDLHQHHLFLIDIVEFFTKGMPGSSAKQCKKCPLEIFVPLIFLKFVCLFMPYLQVCHAE